MAPAQRQRRSGLDTRCSRPRGVRAWRCRRARLPGCGDTHQRCSLRLRGPEVANVTEDSPPIPAPAASLFLSREKPLKHLKPPPHKKSHLEC